MRGIKHSFVLPTFFNRSVNDEDAFIDALKKIESCSIDVIEYYTLCMNPRELKKKISDSGFEGIYLAALCQKQENLNPSSVKEAQRKKAVDKLKECIDFAVESGARSILINSGTRPDDKKDEAKAHDVLYESICTMCDYADKSIEITLEPGDRNVEYRHLIGETQPAVDLAKEVCKIYSEFSLTLDTSHIAQLEEEVQEAVELAKPYCSHIHMANCVLNKESELYGDKHPNFNVENGEFTFEDIYKVYKKIKEEYKGKNLTVGVEIIANQPDGMFLENLTEKMDWFFKNSNKLII